MAEPITAALRRAAELTAAGQPLAAVDVLRPVLTDQPGNSEAWCRLSAACLDAGLVDESLNAAKRAIMLGEPSWGHRLASLALTELGRREEALVSAREAARRDPGNWRNHTALAEALDGVDVAGALTAARRGAELSTGEARPYEVLGDVALHGHDVAVAREAYRQALVIDPTSDHARTCLRGLAGTVGAQPIPALPAAAPMPPRSRAISRAALFLVVRWVAWRQAAGAVVLLIAAAASESRLIAWGGLLVLVALGFVGRGAWSKTPRAARVAPVAMVRANPLLATACGLVTVGLLVLVVWTVARAAGAVGLPLLLAVAVCSLVAVAVATAGVHRRRHPFK